MNAGPGGGEPLHNYPFKFPGVWINLHPKEQK